MLIDDPYMKSDQNYGNIFVLAVIIKFRHILNLNYNN